MKHVASTAIVVTAAVLLLVSLTGCCTAKCCEKFVREPEVVYVPTYQTPPELPLPPVTEWATCDADPADWQGYLRALAEDFLEALAQNAELRHIISAYNAARPAE